MINRSKLGKIKVMLSINFDVYNIIDEVKSYEVVLLGLFIIIIL